LGIKAQQIHFLTAMESTSKDLPIAGPPAQEPLAAFLASYTLPFVQRFALRVHYLLPVFAMQVGATDVGAVVGLFFCAQVGKQHR
jgi:hypothetical protein